MELDVDYAGIYIWYLYTIVYRNIRAYSKEPTMCEELLHLCDGCDHKHWMICSKMLQSKQRRFFLRLFKQYDRVHLRLTYVKSG